MSTTVTSEGLRPSTLAATKCTTPPIWSGVSTRPGRSFANSTRYCGCCTHTASAPVPHTTATVSARNESRRAGGKARKKLRSCSSSPPRRSIAQPSDLHPHDLLVGLDDLVPHLHHQ